ncbi:hypothetical protein Tco_0842244 [Tanacetum coccineum]|uniref:Tf2-1-like SH3-like domain-containing protein n=1 Tax=Tanacetum coccineum TaxID=301880 RepID=A0ABQ5B267_9ASTR
MRAFVIDFGGSYHLRIRCALFEALYRRKCRSHVLWAKIRESSLIGLELVLEMTDKVVLIKEKLKAARDRQKSYTDKRRKPLEFEVGPFEILERIGLVAYRLRLPEELSSVHDTFHVSNLKKCLADANLHVPLDEIKVDKTLCFVEEPVEIMDQDIKKLKRRKIALVKVRWNSKRGPEFTWEQEDRMRIKYPQLFVDRVVKSASRLTCWYPWPAARGKKIWYDPMSNIEVFCLVLKWMIRIDLPCIVWSWQGWWGLLKQAKSLDIAASPLNKSDNCKHSLSSASTFSLLERLPFWLPEIIPLTHLDFTLSFLLNASPTTFALSEYHTNHSSKSEKPILVLRSTRTSYSSQLGKYGVSTI